MEDMPANGWRLFKTSLAANTQPDKESAWESHSVETVVAAQLLELIERESVRRFVVHCGGKSGLLACIPLGSCSLLSESMLTYPALGLQS